MSSSLPPVSVYGYNSVEGLISLVQFKTNCTRSEIVNKPQFSYLTGYLSSDHIKAATMVVEDSYTDRHYLEDYTAYYARCFNNYPKFCTRVHFFSSSFDEEKLLEALLSNNKEFLGSLDSSYVGYIVIKPLPNAFLGGIYLKPYPGLCDSKLHKVIRRKHFANLAGIELKVETVAFTEQDEVVSACATSALWSYLSAYDNFISMSLPSPSAITQSATGENIDGARNFPSEGLTDTQILRSIKHFGYEPITVPIGKSAFPKHNSSLLREYIYAYINNDVPVLLAGMIYKKCDDSEEFELAGPHLICVLGYHIEEDGKQTSSVTNGIRLRAGQIDKYYVHDDRVGPYARFTENAKFKIRHEDKVLDATGLAVSISEGETTEYFYPIELYLGVYHKIRVTYQVAKSISTAVFYYAAKINKTVSLLPETAQKSQIVKLTNKIKNALFSIDLSTTNSVKHNVLELNHAFFSFNGIEGENGKADFIQRNFPKYIWRCRLSTKEGEFLDILLDATEIPSGNMLIGHMAYSADAEELWTLLSLDAKDYLYGDNVKEDSFYNDPDILRLIKLLRLTESASHLNTLFGPIRLPQRELKPGEFNGIQNIPSRTDLNVIKYGNKHNVEKLNLSYPKNIWVINEDGDFVYGEDIEHQQSNGENSYSGHPTLEMNKPVRIGGELLRHSDSKLEINLHSGNYSKHITREVDRKLYLQNVIKHFFSDPAKIKIDPSVTRLAV